MSRSILIHIKNKEQLHNYIEIITNNNCDKAYSKEVKFMMEEFRNEGWNVFLTTIENCDIWGKKWYDIFDVNHKQLINMTIEEINEIIDIMILRNLGSVEAKFKMISNYLIFLIKEYHGKVLNNPKAMVKGMTKDYLTEIDYSILHQRGFNEIPTKIYSNKVHYNEIKQDFKIGKKYLIKPVTGELSNSLQCLQDVNEEYLRYKQDKVGGWVVQPIIKDIWNGEYQLVFLNQQLIYAQKKEYPQDNNYIPDQKKRIIKKYNPSEQEIFQAQQLISYFQRLYNIHIDICRIDYMKDKYDVPILLEFEMVNPGFFIGYMGRQDKDIKNIISQIRLYCEECLSSKVE